MTRSAYDITHRTTVEQWECDYMGHMNVGFYGERFDQAQAVLFTRLGLQMAEVPVPSLDRLEFKRESTAGTTLIGRSAVIGVSPETGTLRVRTEFHHGVTDVLSAVIDTVYEDVPPQAVDGANRCLVAPADVGAPTAVPDAPTIPDFTEVQAKGLRETYIGVVTPTDLLLGGGLTRRALFTRLAYANANLLNGPGNSFNELKKDGLGLAILEFRVRWLTQPTAGDLVTIHSSFLPHQGRAFRYNHQIFDGISGKPLASVLAVSVVFDLAARKAVAIPDHLQQQIDKATAAG